MIFSSLKIETGCLLINDFEVYRHSVSLAFDFCGFDVGGSALVAPVKRLNGYIIGITASFGVSRPEVHVKATGNYNWGVTRFFK